MAKLNIKLVRSLIGRRQDQIDTVKALGLKKINSEAVHEDTPQIRGMIEKVIHLIQVKEV